MELIYKLLRSRKFLVMLASAIGLLIAKYFKVQVDQETILQFVILVSSYLIGEGIAGYGKDAAKVEAITTLTRDNALSGSETKKAVEEIKSV